MSNKIELLKKLQALAKDGFGGEKENAERMLKELMKKHNITNDDLESEKLDKFELKVDVSSKYQFQLFYQICHIVFGHNDWSCFKEKGKRLSVWIESTNCQFIKIESMFSFYLREFERQQDLFFRGFVQKNQLFNLNKDPVRLDELSEEEKAIAKKTLEMADAIEKSNYLIGINKKSGL